MIVDYTTINNFNICRLRWYWRHLRHLVPKVKGIGLAFGHSIHKGLDALYMGGDYIKAFTEDFESFGIEGDDRRNVERGCKILDEYKKTYLLNSSKRKNPFEVVENDVNVVISLPTLHEYACRMDRVVKWKETDDIVVIECKTTSRLGSYYLEQFKNNYQVQGYMIGAKLKYGSCYGYVIDAISTAKNPTCLFLRNPPEIMMPGLEDIWLRQITEIVEEMEEDILKNRFTADKSQCNYYGGCPYLPLCLYGDSVLGEYETSIWDAKEGKEIKNET